MLAERLRLNALSIRFDRTGGAVRRDASLFGRRFCTVNKDLVLLSTADWDNPFWTNKQHVAVELGRLGYRVFYVESLGLRRPSVSPADLKRVLRRLLRGVRSPRMVAENVWVWSPIAIPFHSYAFVRWINNRLISALLSFWLRNLRMRPDLLWTYSPMTTSAIDLDRYRFVVYHCVDDIAAQPGMPQDAIRFAEAQLVQRSDVVFVTASELLAKHIVENPNTHYFPNVADYEHFSKAMSENVKIPDDLQEFRGVKLGLIGAISGYKVDFDLLIEVAQSRPNWSIILIGAVGEGDPWTDAEALKGCKNIHLLGPRPYKDLPGYLKGFDVAILANKSNEYTKSMFPMKFFEYLASGTPVVSTQLPALAGYSDVASFCGDAAEFVESVERALEEGGSKLEARLEAARGNTYHIRTKKMLDVLNATLVAEVVQ